MLFCKSNNVSTCVYTLLVAPSSSTVVVSSKTLQSQTFSLGSGYRDVLWDQICKKGGSPPMVSIFLFPLFALQHPRPWLQDLSVKFHSAGRNPLPHFPATGCTVCNLAVFTVLFDRGLSVFFDTGAGSGSAEFEPIWNSLTNRYSWFATVLTELASVAARLAPWLCEAFFDPVWTCVLTLFPGCSVVLLKRRAHLHHLSP